MNLPEFVFAEIEKEFDPLYAETIARDIIDVMSGNREGDHFEHKLSKEIMEKYEQSKSN